MLPNVEVTCTARLCRATTAWAAGLGVSERNASRHTFLRLVRCTFSFCCSALIRSLGFKPNINCLGKSLFVPFDGYCVLCADVNVGVSRLISKSWNGDAKVVLGYPSAFTSPGDRPGYTNR